MSHIILTFMSACLKQYVKMINLKKKDERSWHNRISESKENSKVN